MREIKDVSDNPVRNEAELVWMKEQEKEKKARNYERTVELMWRGRSSLLDTRGSKAPQLAELLANMNQDLRWTPAGFDAGENVCHYMMGPCLSIHPRPRLRTYF